MSDSKDAKTCIPSAPEGPRPARRARLLALASSFLTIFVNILPIQAQDLAPVPPSIPEDYRGMVPPDGGAPWLDEVRAQRRAWEARRDAAREEYEARRRLLHSQGATRQEAWKEDLRRRRAERQARIEQEREAFRSLGPGQPPPPPGPPPPSEPQDPAKAFASPEPATFPPSGWDNLWYFRGF